MDSDRFPLLATAVVTVVGITLLAVAGVVPAAAASASDTTVTFVSTLQSPDLHQYGYFGSAVAFDENLLVVGSYSSSDMSGVDVGG